MDRHAEFGSTIVIKGEVTAHEDLVVSGRVEGTITVVGHTVTINAGAELMADVRAREIVVSGQVVGDLCADERVILLATADVEGALVAPSLRIVDGGTYRGLAETTKAKSRVDLQLAS